MRICAFGILQMHYFQRWPAQRCAGSQETRTDFRTGRNEGAFMARSIPDLDISTKVRKLFEQLLEALDNAGFTIAAAHTDLARHAFENDLIGHRQVTPHDVGLLLPGEVPMWRAAKG
jgi:hypothetical protein